MLTQRLLVLSVLAITAWCAVLWLSRHQPASVHQAISQLARSLAAAAFLTAGAMRFATWRLTGEAQLAWSAMALIVLGATLPLVAAIRLLPAAGGLSTQLTPAARLLMVFAVISLEMFTLTTSPVNAGLRPLRLVSPLLLGSAIAAAVVVLRGPPLGAPTPVRMVVFGIAEWLATAGWVGLAAAHYRAGRRRRQMIQKWGAASLGLLGAAELIHAVALTGSIVLLELAAGFQLLAAALAVCTSATRLWEVFTATGTRTLKLVGDLHEVRADLADTGERERERLHDARTAIVSVMGASRLLARPESAEGVDPDRLYAMMIAELNRLGAVLDPDAESALGPFRLLDAVEPLVLAHRLTGAEVSLDVGKFWAIGRPEATATAVANLLSNARAHAPESRIMVSATVNGPTVVLRVEDDGPGIPRAEREDVQRRGVRGSTANGPGSGLGLHTAVRAMTMQGGSLALTDRPGGGTSVVLTLLSAEPPAWLVPIVLVTDGCPEIPPQRVPRSDHGPPDSPRHPELISLQSVTDPHWQPIALARMAGGPQVHHRRPT